MVLECKFPSKNEHRTMYIDGLVVDQRWSASPESVVASVAVALLRAAMVMLPVNVAIREGGAAAALSLYNSTWTVAVVVVAPVLLTVTLTDTPALDAPPAEVKTMSGVDTCTPHVGMCTGSRTDNHTWR
jgi:hypothetical protein